MSECTTFTPTNAGFLQDGGRSLSLVPGGTIAGSEMVRFTSSCSLNGSTTNPTAIFCLFIVVPPRGNVCGKVSIAILVRSHRDHTRFRSVLSIFGRTERLVR